MMDDWSTRFKTQKQEGTERMFFVAGRVIMSANEMRLKTTQCAATAPIINNAKSLSRTLRFCVSPCRRHASCLRRQILRKNFAHMQSSQSLPSTTPKKQKRQENSVDNLINTTSSPTPDMCMRFPFPAETTGDAHLGHHTEALVPSAWRQALAPPPNQRHQQGAE